jgi:hypothetical protein
VEYPEMKPQERPNSEECRRDKLADVWRYTHVIIKRLNDEYIEEEIHDHEDHESHNLLRRFALAIVRIVDPLAVKHKEHYVTCNSRHDEAYRVWDACKLIEYKI